MKNIFITVLVGCAMVGFVLPARAVDIGIGGPNDMAGKIAGGAGYSTNVTDTSLSESVGRVIKVVLSLVGTVFLALTIYAGILWMTASGNEEQVEHSKGIITRATIGLVITIGAYGIVVFVLAALSASTGLTSSNYGGDIGQKGFWTSFGQKLKTDGYRILMP